MLKRSLGIIIVILMLASCAAKPKVRYIHRHDPVMDKNGGVVLLVDVCNQIDVVGKGDYCVVDESREIAAALVEPLKVYLEQNGVFVRTEIVPFVCGAFDSPENLSLVAEKAGEDVSKAPKPYAISDEFKNDPEYLNSLTTLSTYILERCILKLLEDSKKKEMPALIVHEDQFKEAVRIIKDRTNASSLVYVGLKGTTISGGKKFGQGLMSFTVAVATGVATMGAVTVGETAYGVMFIPGRDSDGRFSIAGLVNMETEELSWKGYKSAGKNPYTGDKPLEIFDITKYYQIDSLLKDLVYKKEIVSDAGKK